MWRELPRYAGTWCSHNHLECLGLDRFKPCLPKAWLFYVADIKLHVGDLHAVGWGEGLWELMTPVKSYLSTQLDPNMFKTTTCRRWQNLQKYCSVFMAPSFLGLYKFTQGCYYYRLICGLIDPQVTLEFPCYGGFLCKD